MNKTEKLVIVTHRGGKGPFPENTPEAYRHAVEQGAEAVEMDIRLNYITGRFFLAHDFIHHPRRQWNFFEKALAEVPQDVCLVIEFKTVSVFTNIFVRKFQRFHEKYLASRDIIVISFNPIILMRLRRIAPDIPRGFICGSYFLMYVHNWLLWRFVDARYYVLNRRFLSRRSVVWARQRGMLVFTYIVNTVKAWRRVMKYDVDGVITDYPQKFTPRSTKKSQ